MTPERWQEVKEMLAAALERSPDERCVFLDQACSEPDLRREVESLLAAHEQGDSSFMGQPTVERTELKSGTKLGPYTIVAPLGAGGMGVVYRARDERLEREVAIKVLPPGLLTDESARRRFRKEALALAKLSHPHIAVIHDVGEQGGIDYLVMECVPGQSLAEKLKSGSLPEKEVVSLGVQIAAALEEAHEHDIVHRDLKPGNIMVTPKGQAKVLDFGLAKLLRPMSEATTQSFNDRYAVAGTLPYMAPEQLRGEPVDARTDLWALGVVVYEMLTGAHPFEGRTSYELTSAILREPARPLPPHVPLSQQSIIQGCLAKEREQRYQRAAEVRAALEAIGPHTASAAAAAAPSSTRRWMFVGGGLCVLLLLAAGAFEWFRAKRPPPAASQADWMQITDFADSAVSPAFSPDGRILAFIRGGDTFVGDGQINAKLLPNGESVQLTHDSLAKMSPQFSPDGSTIAYTARTEAWGAWNTWTVPVLGGEAHLMLPNAEGLTWIDTEHLLFSEIKTGIHMAVVTATETRDASRDVYVPLRERGMAHRSALSPDHKWVLVAEMDNGGWLPCRLVPFDAGSYGKRVGPQRAGCTYVAWSPNQSWMYFSSDAGGRFHIWRQHFPDGEPEQVTSGATEEEGIAVAPDGGSLITSVGSRQSSLWVRDEKGERPISSEGYADDPRFSPDGKKLYYLVRRNGVSGQFVNGELWVTNLQTYRSERLLPSFLVSGYDISPDGTKVVFSAPGTDNHSHLWLASLNFGFPPRQFVSSVNEDQPNWDGAGRIYFRAAEGELNFLYRTKEDGSERVKMLPGTILEFHAVSPDGRWAVLLQPIGKDPTAQTVANPLEGGAPVTVCVGYCTARWSADGRTFTVVMDTMDGTQTLVAPVSQAKDLPPLPPAGIRARADMEATPGARVSRGAIFSGPKPGLSASFRRDVHRNLYKVPLQ